MQKSLFIDTSLRLGPCPHFWQAAGDDNAYEWTTHSTGDALLREIKKTGCIKWMRNHHVFSGELLLPGGAPVRTYRESHAGEPIYDFSGIDAVYDRWLAAGIRPIVELDFFPSELRDANNLPLNTPAMWEKWRALLRAFLRHLQSRYGAAEIRLWYFETWNEPDFWPRERLHEVFRLHEEAVSAIEEVDPLLRIGGLGTAFAPLCDQFLQQITFGKNSLTGRTGTRCDFISMHQYGASGNTLRYHPAFPARAQTVASLSYWMHEFLRAFPGAHDKEFHFNEWGMISHYEKTAYDFPPLEIRNSEHFPLFMFKLVHLLFTLGDNKGGWLPRILLLWAGAAEAYYSETPRYRERILHGRSGLFAGNRSLTTAHNFMKPIFRGFELLASLGTERLLVQGAPAGEMFSALATHGGGALQILLYNFCEEPGLAPSGIEASLSLSHLSSDGPAILSAVRLDRHHANSYRAWESLGRPESPDAEQIDSLHLASRLNPEPPRSVEVRGGSALIEIHVPAQGAVLLTLQPEKGSFQPPQKDAPKNSLTWRIA